MKSGAFTDMQLVNGSAQTLTPTSMSEVSKVNLWDMEEVAKTHVCDLTQDPDFGYYAQA
jgi:hypothetical protein